MHQRPSHSGLLKDKFVSADCMYPRSEGVVWSTRIDRDVILPQFDSDEADDMASLICRHVRAVTPLDQRWKSW
jgi:hypothetical protein